MASSNSNKKPLTAIRINALKPNNSLSDIGENEGLNILCGKRGSKKIFYRYRSPINGKVKQLTLGYYVASAKDEDLDLPLGKKKLGLASARQILSQLKVDRKSGICPATKFKEDTQKKLQEDKAKELTIERMAEVYLSQHVEDHKAVDENGNPTDKTIKGSRKTIKGQRETRRTLQAVSLKEFGKRLAVDVSHVDIKNLINSILITGTNVQAGRVLNELSLAYSYAIGRPEPVKGINYKHWLPYLPEEHVNPCIQAKMYFTSQKIKMTPTRGTRVLDDNEIVKFLKWLPDSKLTKITKHAMWITLYTGVRSGEAVGAIKSAIDLNKGTWLVKGKTGADRYVQLSYQAVQYIKPLLENPDNKTDYLLPSSRTGKPQWQKQLSEQAWRLRKSGLMLDIPSFTAHDLRRSCRTGLSRLGCPSEVAEAILGHAKAGIEGTYNLYEYEKDCSIWLQKWADHIDVLIGKQPNVVSITEARA